MKRELSFDPILTLSLAGLSGFSLAVIGSTNPSLFPNQLIFFLLGIGLFIFFASIDYRVYRSLIGMLFIVSLVSLLIPFIGPEIRGANRWIDLLGFRLQSSEVAKPFFFIVWAYILSKAKIRQIPAKLIALISLIPVVILIFRQPDLGNVVVYLSVLILLFVAAGLKIRYIIAGSLLSIVLIPFFWGHLENYQKLRILTFVNPGTDPQGAGYNALQSVIAIGSGGWFGMGFGRGTQSHLQFLPEFHTDFAFASLIEEFGFISGLFILFCYFILLTRILFVGRRTPDQFGRLLAIAVFSQILIQVFINIGMNVGILPITGITLPFISYGGSSILGLSIALGLAYSVASRKGGSILVVS